VNAFIVQVYSSGFPFRNDGRVRTASGWTLVVRMQLACDLVVRSRSTSEVRIPPDDFPTISIGYKETECVQFLLDVAR
jgi:hypothetical protein